MSNSDRTYVDHPAPGMGLMALLLKRKARGFGLYLTPNDSKAFLRRIADFAPELTAESIL